MVPCPTSIPAEEEPSPPVLVCVGGMWFELPDERGAAAHEPVSSAVVGDDPSMRWYGHGEPVSDQEAGASHADVSARGSRTA